MKAIIHQKYGCLDSLKIGDKLTPVVKPNQILVKVHATSINDWDAGIFNGTPKLMRLSYGLFSPRIKTFGCDVAGAVVEVGSQVDKFSVGDAVYGDVHNDGFGAFSEYIAVDQHTLVKKPEQFSMIQAAAFPHSATLAWQGLNQLVDLKAGMSLLVNGAGGGVGVIALQIAKAKGVNVTGVDKKHKLEALSLAGFDQVIDCETCDFTQGTEQYDVIFDVKSLKKAKDYIKALKPNGTYITVGGDLDKLFGLLLSSWFVKKRHKKHIKVLGLKANQGLEDMAGAIDAKELVPLVDGPFTFEDTSKAMDYYLKGKAKGRVVVQVSNS